MATEDRVAITLGTIGGGSYDFDLPSTASVLEAKTLAAVDLGRPADLQRWLLDGSILPDSDSLASFRAADSHEALSLLCVFLPRTFQVKVKVVKFSPGSQAVSAAEVFVTVSPSMTIDLAKFESLSASLGADAPNAGSAARLIKGGLNLDDDKTIEHYQIDPNSTLHLVVPRGCGGDDDLPANTSCNAETENGYDDARVEAQFNEINAQGLQSQESTSKDIVSPRSKESASMLPSMGVHRLRPRRSASVPVPKSTSGQAGRYSGAGAPELAPEINFTGNSSCGAPVLDSGLAGFQKDDDDDGDNTDASTDVPEEGDAVEEPLSPASSACDELEDAMPAPMCIPQKPCEPRTAPSRPARVRPTSRCHSRPRISKPIPANEMQPAAASSVRPPLLPVRPPVRRSLAGLERSTCSRGMLQSSNATSATQHSQETAAAASSSSLGRGTRSVAEGPLRLWAHASNASARGARALSEGAAPRRSSSSRAEGIDRWHNVARC